MSESESSSWSSFLEEPWSEKVPGGTCTGEGGGGTAGRAWCVGGCRGGLEISLGLLGLGGGSRVKACQLKVSASCSCYEVFLREISRNLRVYVTWF